MQLSELLRWVFTGFGAILAILEPTLPYIAICTLAIFYDCYTAWRLGRRVAKKYPDKVRRDAHKFSSSHFGRVIETLMKSWAMIVLAFLIETHITNEVPVDMTKVAAGAITFWQVWSMIENESTCSDAKWPRWVKTLMVRFFRNKAHRHLDMELLTDEEMAEILGKDINQPIK